jgi:hypothetical protein
MSLDKSFIFITDKAELMRSMKYRMSQRHPTVSEMKLTFLRKSGYMLLTLARTFHVHDN